MMVRQYTYFGVTLNASNWARVLEISADTLMKRFRVGWSIEKALGTPTRPILRFNATEIKHEDIKNKKTINPKQAAFFKGYKVFSNGVILSKKTGKPMKHYFCITGYPYVSLYDGEGNKRKTTIHRILAQLYIPNPENKPEVNHIDSDRKNFKLKNLEWVTAKENHLHGREANKKRGNPAYCAKLSIENVKDIYLRLMSGEDYREIAKYFRVNKGTIQSIKHKKNWKSLALSEGFSMEKIGKK